MHTNFTSATRCRGFTLFEVLIAVLVLSIGLLGVAGLQVTSLNNSNGSYLRSLATLLANDMADRIRSNPAATSAGLFNNITAKPSSTPASGCNSAACSAADMATMDLANWYDALSGNLPGGTGRVTGNGNTFTVNVSWTDSAPDVPGSVLTESTTFTP